MKVTKSYLVGLARQHSEAQAEIVEYQKLLEIAQKGLDKAQEKLAGADLLIKSVNSEVDTSVITPKRTWKGRYGKRGNLRKTLVDLVNRAGSTGLKTNELVEFYCDIFGQSKLPLLKNEYRENRVAPALKALRKQGKIDSVTVGDELRWVPKNATQFERPSASPTTAQVLHLTPKVPLYGGSRG